METVEEVLQTVGDTVGIKNLTPGVLLKVAAIVLVGWLVIRLLMRMVDRMLDRSRSVASIRQYIHTAVHVFLWVLLALMLAGTLNVDVTSIIAVLSVAGLAVSLALQNTLANLAGGLMILVTKPFAVGDYVEIDAGESSGVVAEIGLAYTKLTTYDGKRVSIPNSQVSAAKIINYTNESGRRVDLVFSASYDAPTLRVKEAILEAVDALPAVRREPAPAVWITKYGSSSIDYVVRVWTSTEDYWNVYNALMEGVRESFAHHGVEMTYDHLNVHIAER